MDPLQVLVDDSAFRYAVLMGCIETLADGSLKAYAQGDDVRFLGATVAGYSAIIYVYQRALRNEKLGRVNAMWNFCTTLSDVAMGMAMGETYSPKQLIGFTLMSVGILMI